MTDKLELKSSHEVIDTVSVADVDSIFQGKPTDPDILTVVMKGGRRLYCDEVCPVDSLQEEPSIPEIVDEHYWEMLGEEPVSKVWHDASKEPNDMSHCLIFYGDKNDVGHYLHYEPVLYNHQERVFVTESFPHPTGYKVEQKSLDGGCVAEVYKNRRDRISISDITSWCYLNDLHNLTQKEDPVSEDLEEEIERYLKDCLAVKFPTNNVELIKSDVRYIARHFANWQRQKDEHEIWKLSHANYEEGKSNMKKQMVREICDWLREYCVPILSDFCVSDLVEDLQRKFGEDAEAGV